MKKIKKIVALLLIPIIFLLSFTGCKKSAEKIRDKNPETFVCYYGCPNSKKAGKLQLKRKRYNVA